MDLDIDWAKDVREDCIQYLKLMVGYDMFLIQIDLEKIKPHFHKKMENGMSGEVTTNLLSFVARALT